MLDDTAGPTKPYGAVNSRVFDALATGTLVVTDNPEGSAELFDGLLPAAEGDDALLAEVQRWLDDPAARAERAARLRELVLERHTYDTRARELRDLLRGWVETPKVELAIGVPDWARALTWGDYHFGRALQGAIERRGMPATLRFYDAWDGPGSERADAAIQLFGLKVRRPRAGQVSALWIISHPDLVDEHAPRRPGRRVRRVRAVHGGARGAGRRRDAPPPVHGHPAVPADGRRAPPPRAVRRQLEERRPHRGPGAAPTPASTSPSTAPTGNGRRCPDGVWRADHVPNDQLPAYYAAADIVLNDTWPDMAAHGFISNRLYDAAAAGAFVLSDAVDGIDAEFDGGVVTFTDGADLRAKVQAYLDDPAGRASHAAAARAAVLERHTVEHRADVIVSAIRPLVAARPARVMDADRGATG